MAISKLLFFFFFFLHMSLCIVSLHPLITHCYSPYAADFDSIYQFGDSLSDTGNFAREDPTTNCSWPPYGQDAYSFARPTGRCSNGLLMVDFFAKALGLPFLNPYLDEGAEFGHGVNFAVGGSSAMSSAELAQWNITPATNSSLAVQLGWFKAHLSSYCSSSDFVGTDEECKQKRLRKALILMEIGGNDYNYPLLDGKLVKDLYVMVPHVVNTIKEGIQEVIDMGAKQVVATGNFPIGCIPDYLLMHASNNSSLYDDLKCLKDFNEFAVFHNNHLQTALAVLRSKNPGVSIFYGDYYCSFRWLLQNAAALGFEEDGVFKACCGKGDNEYNCDPSELCGDEGVPVCKEPAKRLSWDGLHLTQEAYKHLVDWLLSNMFTFSSSSSCVDLQGSENVISIVGKGITTTY